MEKRGKSMEAWLAPSDTLYPCSAISSSSAITIDKTALTGLGTIQLVIAEGVPPSVCPQYSGDAAQQRHQHGGPFRGFERNKAGGFAASDPTHPHAQRRAVLPLSDSGGQL